MGKNVKTLDFPWWLQLWKRQALTFCRASNSQCGGQGFESLLLHQTHSSALFSRLFFAINPSLHNIHTRFKRPHFICLIHFRWSMWSPRAQRGGHNRFESLEWPEISDFERSVLSGGLQQDWIHFQAELKSTVTRSPN